MEMKNLKIASIVAAAAFIGFVGSASAQTPNCGPVNTAKTTILTAVADMESSKITPIVALDTVRTALYTLELTDAEKTQIDGRVAQLKANGANVQAVKTALQTELQPKFMQRAKEKGCPVT